MAVHGKSEDTRTQAGDRAATHEDGAGDLEVTLPEDLPGPNQLSRAVFGTDAQEQAVELLEDDRIIYLLPWCARHTGLAGFVQDLETFRVRPVEFTGDEVRRLLGTHRARYVDLIDTPAWVMHDQGADDVNVSWHARCRWAERVGPQTDPGPAIRRAYHEGVSVGVRQGCGRYYPPDDVVVVYHRTDPHTITTVLPADDLDEYNTDHLKNCGSCGGVYNPDSLEACDCCSGAVCQWCGTALSPVANASAPQN